MRKIRLYLAVIALTGLLANACESEGHNPWKLACEESGGTLVNENCKCRLEDNVCISGVMCTHEGKCAASNNRFELACIESGGEFDNGLCKCGISQEKTPCFSGIVCTNNGTACASNNWTDTEIFQLSCEQSGGTVNHDTPDICYCNAIPCFKKNVCVKNENNISVCPLCNQGETKCQNDKNGIGYMYTCTENGEWMIDHKCSATADDVSCKNENECGLCFNEEIISKTDTTLDNDTGAISYNYQWNICKNGMPQACSPVCSANTDGQYTLSCEDEKIIEVCSNGCDPTHPETGCFCHPGDSQYIAQGKDYEYRVCRGTEWKKDKNDLYLLCTEDWQYLYLRPVPDDHQIGVIKLPKSRKKITVQDHQNRTITDMPPMTCDYLTRPKTADDPIMTYIFTLDSYEECSRYSTFCADSIVSMQNGSAEDGERYTYYIKPQCYNGPTNNQLSLTNAFDKGTQEMYKHVDTFLCNSDHTGIHGVKSGSGYLEVPAYDMKIHNAFATGDQMEDIKIISGKLDYTHRLDCTRTVASDVQCDFYTCILTADNVDPDCRCYADKDTTSTYCKIDSLHICLDFYSSTYEKTSFAFNVNNMGGGQLYQPGTLCPNGCNDDWTDCADKTDE